MNNPYDPNFVNPDLFYGRDGLLSDLLSGLPGSPRNSYGIAGGRRMGKSTLLRRVEKDLKAGISQWRAGGLLIIPIYIDGLELPRPLEASDIWSYILKQTSNVLEMSLPDNLIADFTTFKELLQPIILQLSDRPRIIVIFDEIEPITVCEWAETFFNHWRSLLTNTPELSEYFTAVFSGARDMDTLRRDLTSPLKDILQYYSLRTFEYEDACDLAQVPINVKWSESFLSNLYTETGGHPMLIQYIMQYVCMHKSEESVDSLKNAVVKFEKERSWQFGQWWERYCTPDAQRIYRRLSDKGTELRDLVREFGLQQSNDALEILQHIGIAVAENDGFIFRYAGEMFHRWYEKFAVLSNQPQHDLEIHSRLSRISTSISDKYLTAWRIYQSDVPNYSGVLVELRGVVEAILERYAPKEIVQQEPNFKPESDRKEASLRQQVRYLARKLYDSDRSKEIVSDFNLLEITEQQIENIADATTKAHRAASSMAHETATRDNAYKALKLWDGLLAQLLIEDLFSLPKC